ncbi:MAG: tRNA 2-thiocytidine(32) synthetase TtcA [Opitutaceae bacterium]|nr:tRNA 2-thiocytidine(32) synthetase TtcA [Cytophagales bacterium]
MQQHYPTQTRFSEVEQRLIKKLEKQVATSVKEYSLIEPNDKVMVCLSGGKDSYTMLDMLLTLKSRLPFHCDIIAVNLDQKQPDYPEHILPEYLKKLGVEYKIIERDTYSIVKEKIEPGKTMCSLCSRLRRGILYTVAKEIGATKIALGHHREDILETFFLNLFFGGKLEAMPPKFISDNKENVVIRPLSYCNEEDIQAYADLKKFPIIPCNLCGSQPNMQRKVIKKMMSDWEKDFPGRTETIFTSLHNIHPSHLFDNKLFDFHGLTELAVKNL